MDILQSVAYSSYASEQVFWMLNWKENDKVIKGINSDKGASFTARHNRFSYMSFIEIESTFLTLSVSHDHNLLS